MTAILYKISIYVGLGYAKTLSGLSALAKTGWGAEHLGYDRLGG